MLSLHCRPGEETAVDAPPKLTCPSKPSDTGAFQIEWSQPGWDSQLAESGEADAPPFELYENGVLIYSGGDSATTLTGRTDGTYEYELVAPGGKASCTVDVAMPPRSLAFSLFGVGALVFLATCLLLWQGTRRWRKSET